MTETKYLCDICGKEITIGHLYGLVPEIIIGENPFQREVTFDMKKYDLCEECANKISKYIEEIKVKGQIK